MILLASMQVQQFQSFSKDYHLLYVIQLLPVHKFCDILQHLYHVFKHKSVHQSTTHDENTQLCGYSKFATGESFHVHSLSNRTICIFSYIHGMFVDLIRCNDIYCSKFLRRIMIKPGKSFLSPMSTVPSTASYLHFLAHIPIQKLLNQFSICINVCDKYF